MKDQASEESTSSLAQAEEGARHQKLPSSCRERASWLPQARHQARHLSRPEPFLQHICSPSESLSPEGNVHQGQE